MYDTAVIALRTGNVRQGLLTSGYIILLSRVGERVAADMRKTLFASLLRCLLLSVLLLKPPVPSLRYFLSLRQDVAFFDANKTGQLVNRLTADIQEFKSSFKLVISQVQRKQYCVSHMVAGSLLTKLQRVLVIQECMYSFIHSPIFSNVCLH